MQGLKLKASGLRFPTREPRCSSGLAKAGPDQGTGSGGSAAGVLAVALDTLISCDAADEEVISGAE